MKKNITLFALLIIAFVFNVQAQFTKTDGPVLKCEDEFNLESVIGADNNAIYVYRKEKKGVMYVQRFNKKTYTKEWETDVSLKNPALEAKYWLSEALCYLKGNKIYLYIPASDKDKDNATLMLTVIGTDGKIIGNTNSVGLIHNKFITRDFNSKHGRFSFVLSPDSSKMVLCMSYSMGKTIATIDLSNPQASSKELSDNQEIYGKEPFTDPEMKKTMDGSPISSLTSYAIDNDGKLAYSFISNGSFKINIYNPATKSEQTYVPNFNAGDKFIIEGSDLTFLRKGKLVFTAITTPTIKKPNSNILIAQVDVVNKKVDYETTQTFSEAWKEKYKPGGYDMPTQYDFKFTLLKDGGYVISAFKRGGKNCTPHSLYNELDDAVITKINSTGKIDWMKIMPIKVYNNGFFVISTLKTYVNCFYMNNNMYYIFNDNKKNEELDLSKIETSDETKICKEPTKGDINTTCIMIDLNGNMKRSTIQVHKDLGFYPLSKNVWADKNNLLLYYKDGAKESFSSLTIQ